ncbi:MAG: glycoside hydrolase family 73 protein [Bacillota bacterium]
MNPIDFISHLMPGAYETQLVYGLPAASMISQSAHETGWGKFIVRDINTGRDSKNLFNIKGKGPAGYVVVLTKEYYDGHWIEVISRFRAYNNYAESFKDYAEFIRGNERYAPAVAAAGDPVDYIRKLQSAGYATDPNYASSIISIMEGFKIPVEVNRFVDTVSDWAKASWKKAVDKKILDGTSPKGPVTREMLAVVVDKLGLLDSHYIEQHVVDRLKELGLITEKHPVAARVTWGELAAVVLNMKKQQQP